MLTKHIALHTYPMHMAKWECMAALTERIDKIWIEYELANPDQRDQMLRALKILIMARCDLLRDDE